MAIAWTVIATLALVSPAHALVLGGGMRAVGLARARPAVCFNKGQAQPDSDACRQLSAEEQLRMSDVSGVSDDTYFCSEPSEDATVTCFQTPEWMAAAENTTAEWVCMRDDSAWALQVRDIAAPTRMCMILTPL